MFHNHFPAASIFAALLLVIALGQFDPFRVTINPCLAVIKRHKTQLADNRRLRPERKVMACRVNETRVRYDGIFIMATRLPVRKRGPGTMQATCQTLNISLIFIHFHL